jgi:hypothetical protein
MTGDVIKSFLVSLGFDVDDSSLKKFNDAIKTSTLRVAGMAAAVTAAAAGIVKGISSVSQSFEDMGYEMRLIAPSLNRVLYLRRELLKSYAAAGVNIRQVVQDSVRLNISLTKTRYAFEAIYKSVASRFFTAITKQSDTLRDKLYKNMPKIQAGIEKFVGFIFKAFGAIVTLGERIWSILTRVYDFFVDLDKATDGWSTKILGFIALWEALNLSFLATPLGMILSGLLAILALYDDFKTFQEGGKSFFDWSSFIPVINAVSDALSGVWDVVKNLLFAISSVVDIFKALFKLDFNSAFRSFADAVQFIVNSVSRLIDSIFSLVTVGSSLGKWASGLFSGSESNVAANIANNPAAAPIANPVGSNVQNSSQTNINATYQSNMTVQGSADANATANIVNSQQKRQAFDFTRNLQGAVRAQ